MRHLCDKTFAEFFFKVPIHAKSLDWKHGHAPSIFTRFKTFWKYTVHEKGPRGCRVDMCDVCEAHALKHFIIDIVHVPDGDVGGEERLGAGVGARASSDTDGVGVVGASVILG